MQASQSEKQCWEVEGTLCNHHGIQLLRDRMKDMTKEEICIRASCIYYRYVHNMR